MDERVWILLAKRSAGEATAAELIELEALLKNSPDSVRHEALEKIWKAPLQSLPGMKPGKPVWDKIAANINSNDQAPVVFINKRNLRWLAAAMAAAVIVGLFYINTHLNTNTKRYTKTIITKPSAKQQLVLPDGTQVWLNGNSHLTYNEKTFGQQYREVTLSGEAFFDVTKNAAHPFIIHAANVNITVKGTAFNVKAYPAQKHVETSLLRGLVEVTTQQDPERKILLRPDEKIIIAAETPAAATVQPPAGKQDASLFVIARLQKDEQNVLPETVWMNQSLTFNNEPLEQLVPKLESWFSTTIHIEDNALKTKRFSGVITGETMQQTLEALKLSYPFYYTIKQGEVWITK
ncbi:FecR family protein [Chitinophaga defluvii]|uniref:FecR family protein n=1 Tax=Chitinophaga defluvii TaxID=3163343 RepID=A0ABV2T1G9_9BACT